MLQLTQNPNLMVWLNTRSRYGLVAKILHWGLAILLIGMLGFGTYLADLKVTFSNFHLFGLHKSLGLLALSLIVLRLFWRALSPAPKLISDNTSPAQIWMAKATHMGLLTVMLLMPSTGWIASSAAEFDIRFFDLFALPKIVATNPQTEAFFFKTHAVLGKIFVALIVLHIIGALLRHFRKKDDTLKRMWF